MAPTSAGSTYGGAASTIAYGTFIFGSGFYGVTELDGGIKTEIITGASKSDPMNQTSLYSWKANFTAKMLNASAGAVLWTGSGQTATATTDFNAADPTVY